MHPRRMRPTVVTIVAIALLTAVAAAVLLAGRNHDETSWSRQRARHLPQVVVDDEGRLAEGGEQAERDGAELAPR